MKYIVIDLEWNQPMSYQSRTFREVGDRLIFEMIQIGAVKLDEQLNIIDSISVPIQPTHYVKIHPRIRRMTQLGPEILDNAPHFEEAMAQFVAWCGEDYTLLTWGCDDVSVLQQNLDFFDVHPQLPVMCDIQKLFSDVYKLKDRMGLKPAMDMLEIVPDEDKAFHNAVNDAYYTALVFSKIPEPDAVLRYPQQPKKLIHADHEAQKRLRSAVRYASLAEALASEEARQPRCPACGKPAVQDGEYVPQSADKYIGLAKCNAHGMVMTRLRFFVERDGRIAMNMVTAKAAPSNVAYIHTKAIQIADRKARGIQPDPEQALLNAERSSVPFEE